MLSSVYDSLLKWTVGLHICMVCLVLSDWRHLNLTSEGSRAGSSHDCSVASQILGMHKNTKIASSNPTGGALVV